MSSYLTPFTLTFNTGGIVSVALSLGSPPVAVSNCHVLRCPDFPPAKEAGDRLTNCLCLLYLLFSLCIKYLINHSVGVLVKFTLNVAESDFLEVGYECADAFMNRP